MCQSSVLSEDKHLAAVLLWLKIVTFNASDVSDAADDCEYWQIISQVCNLVILCDGLNIMILFLLCLERMNDKVLFWLLNWDWRREEDEEEEMLTGMYESQDNNRNDNQ
jgi:hypothetical protein